MCCNNPSKDAGIVLTGQAAPYPPHPLFIPQHNMNPRFSFGFNDSSVAAGNVWLGSNARGPQGHAHGGCIAALLDQASSCTALSRDVRRSHGAQAVGWAGSVAHKCSAVVAKV